MTIELPASVERELEDLAVAQQRNIGDLVEEAIRHYLEAAAISDLDSVAVGEAQLKMAGEFTRPNGSAESSPGLRPKADALGQ